MIGLIAAILTAFFRFFADVLSKLNLERTGDEEIDPLTLSLFYRLTGIIPLFLAVLILGVPSNIDFELLLVLLFTGPALTVATILFLYALNYSDISLVTPIKTISPVLVVVTGFLILGEVPSFQGLAGVAMVFIGIYTLQVDKSDISYLEPLKKTVSDRGVQLVVIMMIIYGISAPLDKIGVEASSPAFYALCLYTFGSVGLLSYHFLTRGRGDITYENVKKIYGIGIFNGLSSFAQMTAFSLTLVVYVVSIKRLSTVMSSVYGAIFLEEGMRDARILGSILVTFGAIILGVEIL